MSIMGVCVLKALSELAHSISKINFISSGSDIVDIYFRNWTLHYCNVIISLEERNADAYPVGIVHFIGANVKVMDYY